MNKKIICVILGLLVISSIWGQVDYDNLQQEFEKKQHFKQQVYNKTLGFISQNQNSASLPRLYFQVAELSIELDVDDPGRTVFYLEKVLQLDPEFERLDVVLYNIGYYNYEAVVKVRNELRLSNVEKADNWPDDLRLSENKLRKSIDAFKRIQVEFPESEYNTEAIYRLGTIYFEIALDSRNPAEYYPKAIIYFDLVASRENDPLKNYGLFQRGWTHFVSGNYEEAIIDFSSVLNLINNSKNTKDKLFFEADALENIAYSLIEYDDTDYDAASLAADKAKEIFSDFVTDEYAKEIIKKAIDLELTYSAPIRAIDFYNTYIDLYSLSPECPTFIDSIITLYKKFPDRTRNDVSAELLITAEMERLVREYNYNSPWYRANAHRGIDPQLAVIKNAFEFLEPRYYNAFVNGRNHSNFNRYSDLIVQYRLYEVFSSDECLENKQEFFSRVVLISQYLVNETEDPDDYFASIQLLKKFNKSYPDNENFFRNREDVFILSEAVYELLDASLLQGDSVSTVTYGILEKPDLDLLYIEATMDYENMLKDSTYTNQLKNDELIRVTYRRAELYYSNNKMSLAENDYQSLLSLGITSSMQTDCYARLAEINRGREDYAAEENYYRQALEYAPADEKEVYFTNIMASIQTNAQQQEKSNDYSSAAEQYLRLAEELKSVDPQRSIGFRLQAIDVLQTANQYQKAIDQLLIVEQSKTTKKDKFAALFAAWSISDTLLNDYAQSINLRQCFIDRYPSSNEAYNLRLQVIGFYEGNIYNDKRKAADMYFALYNDAVNMDLGGEKRENILLKSIALYRQVDAEDVYVDLMLDFEKRYPNHPTSNDFLTQVAFIYEQRGDTESYEEMARYIYKKDPSIDIFTPIIAAKLNAINTNIDSHFMAQDYNEMYQEIEAFKAIDNNYKREGGTLDLSAYYSQYDYYNAYITFDQKFDDELMKIDTEFMNVSADILLRVNANTKWKVHIINGRRLENLMVKTDKIRDDLIALIQEGIQYNLPMEKRTEALYKAGLAYDYGAEVALKQIRKYVDVSTQLNSAQMNANPVEQAEYKKKIRGFGKKESYEFSKKGTEMYLYIVRTFLEDQDYQDEWTEAAYQQLVDLGLRSTKIYVTSDIDSNWKIRPGFSVAQDNSWDDVTIAPDSISFDLLNVVQFHHNDEVSITGSVYAEMKPEILKIRYLSTNPISIILNGDLLGNDHELLERRLLGENYYNVYAVKFTNYTVEGKNSVYFQIHADSSSSNNYFAAEIMMQYDEAKLNFMRNTDKKQLITDSYWQTIIADNIEIDVIPDSNWTYASEAHFSFFKNQMHGLEESDAVEIWVPRIDTTRVQSVYFSRDFTINSEFVEANAKYLAQQRVNIWINGAPLVIDQEIVVDQKLQKAMAQEIVIPNLIQGKNRILIKVEGGVKFKGLIFEMDYVVMKEINEAIKSGITSDTEENVSPEPDMNEEENESLDQEGL